MCLLLNPSDVYRSLALLLSSSINLNKETNESNQKKKPLISQNSNLVISDEDMDIDFVVNKIKIIYFRVKW